MRSIPARTGEPPGCARVSDRAWVYPRTYGGTVRLIVLYPLADGLSPHVRGNLLNLPLDGPHFRSIPARTGEPVESITIGGCNWVYPRTYGGTVLTEIFARCDDGLSPHVRGNPQGDVQGRIDRRSIPARTGEPGFK